MARRRTPKTPESSEQVDPKVYSEQAGNYSYCALPAVPEREFAPDVNPNRASLIVVLGKKWVNETILHYYFFDQPTDGRNVVLANGTRQWRPWTTTAAEKEVVRRAFAAWKAVWIGLTFQEVNSRDEAEIRIGFMRGDGAWSYIGRDIIDLGIGRDERTMNFGWDLTRSADEIDTAIHEIGHTLGFPHEHQNPNAGIVWDEEAVYTALAQPPNSWDRNKTFHNIIRKIDPDTVQGSSWDPNSIMHYPFGSGLIKEPTQYRTGLQPAGGLSERDRTWVKTFYPAAAPVADTALQPGVSVQLQIGPGEQRNFVIKPNATRYYDIQTFGISDTVVVLFEKVGTEFRYLSGDDDSGEDRNASIRVRLRKDREYALRLRLYYADRTDETAVMLW
jgi:hypothetical protein